MGIVFAEREPHVVGLIGLLLLLVLATCGFLLAWRWPRTSWLSVAVLLALVFWPIWYLADWFFRGVLGPAQYMTQVYVKAAVEAVVILLVLTLPILGARQGRRARHTPRAG